MAKANKQVTQYAVSGSAARMNGTLCLASCLYPLFVNRVRSRVRYIQATISNAFKKWRSIIFCTKTINYYLQDYTTEDTFKAIMNNNLFFNLSQMSSLRKFVGIQGICKCKW